MAYFIPRKIIRTNNSLDCNLRTLHRCLIVSNQKYVLLIIIIRLGCRTLFLASFTSYKDFTVSLLLKSFLIQAFWANYHSYVVNTSILGDIDFLFQLVRFMNCFKYFSFWIVRILVRSPCEKISLLGEN